MRQREIERKQRVQAAQRQLDALDEQVQKGTTHSFENGRGTTFIPLSQEVLKQMGKLSATISRNPKLVTRKRKKKGRAVSLLPAEGPVSATLLTDQMLAARWPCSTSRLQYWRSHGQGVPYLKICGRVLYRLEDITSYEQHALITPEVIPSRKATSKAAPSR